MAYIAMAYIVMAAIAASQTTPAAVAAGSRHNYLGGYRCRLGAQEALMPCGVAAGYAPRSDCRWLIKTEVFRQPFSGA